MRGIKPCIQTRVLLTAIIFVMASASAFAQAPCPRYAVGSQITRPEDLYSASGLLSVTFTYQTLVDSNGLTRYCYVNSDGQQSPTLHVKPGDTIALTVTNDLPASAPMTMPGMSTAAVPTINVCGDSVMTQTSVNVHFHGMNVSPVCHQDEVINTLINSGSTFTYNLVIPHTQPPGLYWYHPHVHGIADDSVLGGASGAIIVEGIQNVNPIVTGLPQQLLIIRDNFLPTTTATTAPVPARDVSLNYIPVPYPTYTPAVINVPSGQQQFWRVVNSSADTMINLAVMYDGAPQSLSVVELDGVPVVDVNGVATTIPQNQILLPPAARAEFILTGPASTVKNAQLVTLNVATGTGGLINPKRPLATILPPSAKVTVSNPIVPKVSGRAAPLPGAGLATATPTAARMLHFSEDEQGFYITVNGHIPRRYSPDLDPAITTTQGSIEDWTIQNHSLEAHEFHIHQIHFLLMQRNGTAVPAAQQQLMDTIFIPGWSGKGGYPSVTVRMDFRGPDVGQFVYHCHILKHEDGGMMQILRVLPANPPSASRTVPTHTETASHAFKEASEPQPVSMDMAMDMETVHGSSQR